MNIIHLDEAVALYLYLKDRAPGTRSMTEEAAFAGAWKMICDHSEKALHRIIQGDFRGAAEPRG